MEYVEDSMHELKENVGDSVPKTIAAFANTEGGDLLIGIKDDGVCSPKNNGNVRCIMNQS